jgi:hypothetical protein
MAAEPRGGSIARVSPELAKVLRATIEDHEQAQPATLGDVRARLAQSGMQWSAEGELEFPQDRTSLIIELDGLIGEYGEKTPAVELIDVRASEGLARAIEAALADAGLPPAAALGAVRQAIATRLVGEGGIEADQEDAILAELDELIARYGATVRARTFVR